MSSACLVCISVSAIMITILQLYVNRFFTLLTTLLHSRACGEAEVDVLLYCNLQCMRKQNSVLLPRG